MIKAVFFDLYHTLVRYDPPREELEAEALKEFGIDIAPEALKPSRSASCRGNLCWRSVRDRHHRS